MPMLDWLGEQWATFGFCAWCDLKFSSHHAIEQHHLSAHAVTFQVSESSAPSVFQTVMEKKLQLRQRNFGPVSEESVDLRRGMQYEETKKIIGTIWRKGEDARWVVKAAPF